MAYHFLLEKDFSNKDQLTSLRPFLELLQDRIDSFRYAIAQYQGNPCDKIVLEIWLNKRASVQKLNRIPELNLFKGSQTSQSFYNQKKFFQAEDDSKRTQKTCCERLGERPIIDYSYPGGGQQQRKTYAEVKELKVGRQISSIVQQIESSIIEQKKGEIEDCQEILPIINEEILKLDKRILKQKEQSLAKWKSERTQSCKSCKQILRPGDLIFNCLGCNDQYHKECWHYKDLCKACKVSQKPSTIKKVPLIKLPTRGLAEALNQQGLLFSDEIIYDLVEAQNNDASKDPFVREMTGPTLREYQQIRNKTQKGNYQSVEVVQEDKIGFSVKAIDTISKGTIICSYSGNLRFLKQVSLLKNDSKMTLLETGRSDTTLIIIPLTHANLAKYISGINNVGGQRKQNVISQRYKIANRLLVLLIALKNIQSGEVLYYDYNEDMNLYPTENFH